MTLPNQGHKTKIIDLMFVVGLPNVRPLRKTIKWNINWKIKIYQKVISNEFEIFLK
jgi:hypothetical protein